MGLKNENSLRANKSHCAVADVDIKAAESQLSILQSIFKEYGERNVFNSDESALYYRRTPKIMIGSGLFLSRKIQKDCVSVLFGPQYGELPMTRAGNRACQR